MASLDVVDFVVNKGHGVRGLATLGLRNVPEEYLQPPAERFDAAKVLADDDIPTIDVSEWGEGSSAAAAICEAARRYGFFQVVNHGIPQGVLDGVEAAAHRFFELPTEEKIKYKVEAMTPGCAKLGTSFSPMKEKVMEWKDYLSLQCLSQGPAFTHWPPIIRDEVADYYTRVLQLAEKIYHILLKGLNVQSGFDASKRSLLMGWVAVNLNYYPYCPNPDATVGVGRHSDSSALTVLLQDDVGGLYVRAPEGDSWIPVSPKRGALVINIGDMLQILSNGRYKSVEHKVVTSLSKNRVSVATFVNPGPMDKVAPLAEVLERTGDRPVYREVVFMDYFKYFFGKGHDGKATIEWAKM